MNEYLNQTPGASMMRGQLRGTEGQVHGSIILSF